MYNIFCRKNQKNVTQKGEKYLTFDESLAYG